MTITIHETRFHENTRDGTHRAVCSCGWFRFGSLAECQAQAAAHDFEWEAVEPQAQPVQP